MLPVKKVEADNIRSSASENLSERQYAAIGHVTTGSVGAHEESPARTGAGGLENRRGLIRPDLDTPFSSTPREDHRRIEPGYAPHIGTRQKLMPKMSRASKIWCSVVLICPSLGLPEICGKSVNVAHHLDVP